MAELPPVSLGVHILAGYAAALALRRPLETRVVLTADDVRRPKRQFVFDFLLGIAAGFLAAALNVAVHGFPPASTFGLIYGVLIYSFFIALDMSLARERTIILDALARNGLRFTQFYNTTRCCPTRASLLTGLYPHTHGHRSIWHLLQPGERNLFQDLKQAELLDRQGWRDFAAIDPHPPRACF